MFIPNIEGSCLLVKLFLISNENLIREVHLVPMGCLGTPPSLRCRPLLAHDAQGNEAKRELRGSELDTPIP